MEVVGGVESIITLIEATGVLAKVSRDLVLRWRHAPHEIQALATRLSLLAAELQSIKNATARSHPVLTDAIIRQSLSDLLTDVRKRLAKLESLHSRLEQHGSMRQKVEWAAKAGSVEKMLGKTQEVEQRLANLMALISLKAQTPILEGLERIEQMVSTLVISLPVSMPVAPSVSPISTVASNTLPFPGSGPAVRRTLVSSPWMLAESWEPWGLRGSIVTTQQGAKHQYDIRFSISSPLARLLGGYVLTGCLSLQSNLLGRNTFTFRHPSYFAVARVVERWHPFMMACRLGDITTVRSMLRSGEGRPSDVTANGRTPMSFAVNYGNTEVMAELLNCGVDVNGITDYSSMETGLIQSSRRKDLDTVRFLLQRGASADPMDYAGYGASAKCWLHSDLTTKHSSMEIFNLLVESTYFDLDLSRTLCIASIDACGSQIDSLVQMGGDVHYGGSIHWTPIHMAAFCGNLSAYLTLVSYCDRNLFRDDLRFPRMFLIAMCGLFRHRSEHDSPREYDKIVIDMIQRGFDTRGRQYVEQYPWIPPGVRGMEMTADELAKALGPDIEAWYLSVLLRCGLLTTREDTQRLRELTRVGYAVNGFVYDCGDEENEANFDFLGDCAESESSEDDQFWDAEENV